MAMCIYRGGGLYPKVNFGGAFNGYTQGSGSIFYTYISRTSAVSSTNFGSMLIFASCVVGTCNVLCG